MAGRIIDVQYCRRVLVDEIREILLDAIKSGRLKEESLHKDLRAKLQVK